MRIVRSISGSAGARILQFGKLAQHLGHFVAALAAADEDDDFGVGPFGELMLRDGLAGAEPAGDGRRAAFADREEGVNDALTGDQRLGDAQPLANRPRHAHRPLLKHRDLARAGRRFNDGQRIAQRVFTFLNDEAHRAGHVGRNQDTMPDQRCLGHLADGLTGNNGFAATEPAAQTSSGCVVSSGSTFSPRRIHAPLRA